MTTWPGIDFDLNGVSHRVILGSIAAGRRTFAPAAHPKRFESEVRRRTQIFAHRAAGTRNPDALSESLQARIHSERMSQSSSVFRRMLDESQRWSLRPGTHHCPTISA